MSRKKRVTKYPAPTPDGIPTRLFLPGLAEFIVSENRRVEARLDGEGKKVETPGVGEKWTAAVTKRSSGSLTRRMSVSNGGGSNGVGIVRNYGTRKFGKGTRASTTTSPLTNPSTPIHALAQGFQEYMHIPDPMALYVLLGAMAGNMHTGTPVWLMIAGNSGCQPKGSKVLTSIGTWKNVEDVQIGDRLASPQIGGGYKVGTVTELKFYHNRDIYKVELTSKTKVKKSFRCADNHMLALITKRTPRSKAKHLNGKWEWRRFFYEPEVREFLKQSGDVQRTSIAFTTTAIPFRERSYKVHPYIVGALLGDGGMTTNIPIFTTGSVIIKAYLERLGVKFGINYSRNNGRTPSFGILNPLAKEIKKLSCFGCGSYDKRVPPEYMRGSIQQRLHLLAGLIDTDGSRGTFSSVSKGLCQDFADLVHSVGGSANVSKKNGTYKGEAHLSYRVHYALVEHTPKLMEGHKRLPVRNVAWKDPRRHAFKVIPDGREDVYGFVLDSPSQWYVTDDWIVTHNSGKTKLLKSLLKLERVRSVASIKGEAALLSGTSKKERAKDATGGLLKELGDNGCLAFMDFTSFMSKGQVAVSELLAILRELFDKTWKRDIGGEGGRSIPHTGRVCLVAGVTHAIDRHADVNGEMGQRCLYFRLPDSTGYQESRSAVNDVDPDGSTDAMQDIVQGMFQGLGLSFRNPTPRKRLDTWTTDRIVELGRLGVKMRNVVPRDWRTREVIDVPSDELATRMSQQLAQLWVGMEVIGVSEEERWAALEKITMDSMPLIRRLCLETVMTGTANGGLRVSTASVARAVRVSETAARRTLEDLQLLGVLDKVTNSSGGEASGGGAWRLSKWAEERLVKARGKAEGATV